MWLEEAKDRNLSQPEAKAGFRSALEKARQRRQLKAAEVRYRSLFDNVPIGLCRITSTGQFLDANPARLDRAEPSARTRHRRGPGRTP